MELVKYKDVYVRKGLSVDKSMVNDCLGHYSLFDDLEGAIVMDWGMNIGAFGKMVLQQPIKQYIGVECHPDNFEVAKRNLGDDPRVTLIQAAVGIEDGDLLLHLTRSKQNFCSGTVHLKSDRAKSLRPIQLNVKSLDVKKLLENFRPTHVKCDIEGSEYPILEYLNYQFPDSVQQLAIEFHWANRITSEEGECDRRNLEKTFKPIVENLNYVPGSNVFKFKGEEILHRNVWGLDSFYRRKEIAE